MVEDIKNKLLKDIDSYAGERLKTKRQELGLTQKEIAKKVGVTFQQIQKYEKGLNRIGASRLYEFCQILKVSPSFFFQNMGEGENEPIAILSDSGNVESSKDLIEIIQIYNSVKDNKKRKFILDVVKALVAS